MKNIKNKPSIVFFGTDDVSVAVLKQLNKFGFTPDIIVTQPDRPQGRKMELTPPLAKEWAKENNIPVLQPEKLNNKFVEKLQDPRLREDKSDTWDLFIVASYGIIMPKKVIDIPKHKTLNVHPSLLPIYRGPTPIETAILNDTKETGVTIMRMDDKMDHGPILDQEFMFFEEWPDAPELREKMATEGGKLLAAVIPAWIDGDIEEQEQQHDAATFTKLIEKKDGEISLDNDPYQNFLKYKAYKPWPGVFFFKENKRIKITEAEFANGEFIIKKVIPEGKKEIDYKVFIGQ